MVHAQKHTISGWVSDSTKEPLPGASISLNGGKYSTIANSDGTFTFSDLPDKQYVIHISPLGYKSYTDSIVPTGKTTNLKVILTPATTALRKLSYTIKQLPYGSRT